MYLGLDLMAQDFRAVVVKKDITPKNSQQLLGYGARKSTGVHDRIYHRIAIMDDGRNPFVLISSDICLISPAEYDRVKELVIANHGIESDQFGGQ